MDSKPIEHEDTNTIVPWKVYEKAMVMSEVREKRKDIIIIVLIVLMALSNALWVYYWNQYEYTTDDYSVDIDSDGGGNANYIGNDGDIYNGTDNSTQESNEKNTR